MSEMQEQVGEGMMSDEYQIIAWSAVSAIASAAATYAALTSYARLIATQPARSGKSWLRENVPGLMQFSRHSETEMSLGVELQHKPLEQHATMIDPPENPHAAMGDFVIFRVRGVSGQAMTYSIGRNFVRQFISLPRPARAGGWTGDRTAYTHCLDAFTGYGLVVKLNKKDSAWASGAGLITQRIRWLADRGVAV